MGESARDGNGTVALAKVTANCPMGRQSRVPIVSRRPASLARQLRERRVAIEPIPRRARPKVISSKAFPTVRKAHEFSLGIHPVSIIFLVPIAIVPSVHSLF